MSINKYDLSILKKVDALWEDYTCVEEFEFLNEEDFDSVVLPYLRECNEPCSERYLKRINLKNKLIKSNDYTQDDYYVAMINDTLKAIRSGETAYIFHLYQVAEVLRFEPNANFYLHDGIYYVNKAVR